MGVNEIQHKLMGSQAQAGGTKAAELVWASVARDKSPGDQEKARQARESDLDFLVVTNTRTAV